MRLVRQFYQQAPLNECAQRICKTILNYPDLLKYFDFINRMGDQRNSNLSKIGHLKADRALSLQRFQSRNAQHIERLGQAPLQENDSNEGLPR
jgi:hypothetical protein